MSTQERIAKLQWVLQLCVELEQEDGFDLSETKADVENKIKELLGIMSTKKIMIFMLNIAWSVLYFAVTTWSFVVVAYSVGDAMPDELGIFARLAIGLPCIFAAPLCVALMFISISRRLDRKGWLGIR